MKSSWAGSKQQIHMRTWGSPSSAGLLLLRPLGGAAEAWDDFAAHLSTTRFVVVYDPRGRGCSARARFPTTTRSMARDAIMVLEHSELRRVDVFGLSLGGMVAMQLASLWPARVRRLVLGSTVGQGYRMSRASLGRLLELGRCMTRSIEAAEICLARQMQRSAGHGPEARAASVSAGGRLDILQLLLAAGLHHMPSGRIPVPTSVLAGELDEIVSPRVQQRFAQRIGARFRIIPDAGHDLVSDAPRAVADAILDHVDTTEATETGG